MASNRTARAAGCLLGSSNLSRPSASLCRATKVHQRALHLRTPVVAPLHLDFLAPSWQNTRPTTRAEAGSSTWRHLRGSELQGSRRRGFATSTPRPAIAITNPRTDDDGNAMNITITPRAAHRLQAISAKDANPDLALRVSVESGGCHGFQYLMSLVNASEIDGAEDTLFENEEVTNKKDANDGDYKAKVVMDEPSLELLKGSSIDYTMELIGSQFKVTGIPGAKSSCGCGTSFDIGS